MVETKIYDNKLSNEERTADSLVCITFGFINRFVFKHKTCGERCVDVQSVHSRWGETIGWVLSRGMHMKSEVTQKIVWANEQIINSTLEYKDDFCVLNDIGCGELTKEGLVIKKKSNRNAYHALINGAYEDPDRVSIVLYMLFVNKYHQSITKYGVSNFCISKRDSKSYCISATLNNGNVIELASDWVLSWDIIAGYKENQFEIVKKTHTIMGHPLWPCRMVNRHNTINQARNKNKCQITMKDTLSALEQCYKGDFSENIYESEKDKMLRNLKRAFCDNKEWFLVFGEKSKGYNTYIDFWNLQRFEECEITQDNVLKVFS